MLQGFKMICPVCGRGLAEEGRAFVCLKRHSFDMARQGYINLLPVQNKHSLAPGDAKEMLAARRNFLDKGYYQPIGRSVSEMIRKYCRAVLPIIADVGCGEGYYTAAFEKECRAHCMGVDISKEAARMACARSKSILWIVATASHLPVESDSLDAVTAIFSLFMNDEYARVLKSGGIVVEVTAGSDHLKELKALIYDEVFEQHKRPSLCGSEFQELCMNDERFEIELDHSELSELLLMTPHVKRMKKEKRDALDSVDRLKLTVNYIVRVLRKR